LTVRLLAAAFLVASIPLRAAEPQPIVEQVRARAAASGFDGTILIGEPDGSSKVLTVGTRPVPSDAVWRWASITKQLAAIIAMQEVERGRLDLDAPVRRYWPDWRAPNAGTIRIRDLLWHQSGLPQPDESAPDAQAIPAFYRSAARAPAESAAGFCAGPPRKPAPAAFHYNNCDTIVLAEVLRRITGKPFEVLLRERISRPTGARSIGIFRFGAPLVAHVRPIGEFSDLDLLINLGVNGASAGAYGTIQDLWRIDRALLTGKLLTTVSRETMWESDKKRGFYAFHQWVFPSKLAGCAGPVRIVERQGLVGGISLRNYLLPESGRALILFSRKRPIDYGDPWEGKGLAYDLLSKVACR
jgi:D-alanyl-D-alanine carboxypeptidase